MNTHSRLSYKDEGYDIVDTNGYTGVHRHGDVQEEKEELPFTLTYKDESRTLEENRETQQHQLSTELRKRTTKVIPMFIESTSINDDGSHSSTMIQRKRQIFYGITCLGLFCVLVRASKTRSTAMTGPSFVSFTTAKELRTAINAYVNDSSTSTEVAQAYGHPIGSW
jgi:hypothetical protein